MPEPRADMLPPIEAGPVPVLDVKPPTPAAPAPAASPVAAPVAPVIPAPAGAATPPENLKAALDEERLRRKMEREAREAAEARVKELEEAAAHPENVVSDDDLTPGEKLLKKQLEEQNKKLLQMARDREMDRVVAAYPALQDNRSEFETFCEDYPSNTGREKLAKVFLSEKGLLDAIPTRKGLESATHGPTPAPSTTKFSAEEIDRMMKAEPRRFNALIQKGVIRPEDIPGGM